MNGNRKKMIFASYVTLISMVILAVASYAWMSISSSPAVSNLYLSIVTDNALEIAPDEDGSPGEWGSNLDLKDLSGEVPEIRPVTFSAEKFTFMIPRYGLDGRVISVDPIRMTDLSDNLIADTSVTADTEASDYEGYFLKYSFWMHSESTDCVISLSLPEIIEEEKMGGGTYVIGEPEWNEETMLHEDNPNNGQYAIRVGFLIKATETYPEDIFVIFEPNADGNGEAVTYSVDGKDIPLEGDNKLIKQKSSSFTETDPVLKDTVLYTTGEFYDNDQAIFKLKSGEDRLVTLFVWLEGQDKDCTNAISGGKILANIQFTASENAGDNPITPE